MFKMAEGILAGQHSGSNLDPYFRMRAFLVFCGPSAFLKWVQFRHNTSVLVDSPSAFCAMGKMTGKLLIRMAIHLSIRGTEEHKDLVQCQMGIRFSHRLSPVNNDKTRLIPSRFPQYVAVIAG